MTVDPVNGDASNGMLRWSDWLYRCGAALLGAIFMAGLIEPVLTLGRFVPLDPNEGWNAFFGQIALRGGDLYPAPGSLIVNNYPPLSFYIVGSLGRLMGDNIFAGRIIALSSMAFVAFNIHAWLRASGSGARIAWLGAGLFAAYSVTWARSYAGINDPQWLAHAIMTAGMVVIRRGNAGARAIFWGALLILAGGWTKHLLIPLPLAVTWWLWRRSKASFVTWIACSTLLLALTALAAWRLYGPAFFESLPSAREYSLHQAIKESGKAFKCFAPIIALSLLLLPRGWNNERYGFALAYLLAATVVAVGASGGIGVDINAFFDVMISASLCATLAVEQLWSKRLPGALRWLGLGPALTAVLGAYLFVYAATFVPTITREIHNLDALERQTLQDVRLIAERGHGRAACETPELCYWAKGAFTLDFFNVGERLKVGAEPGSACASIFDGVRLPLLQLDPSKSEGSAQLPADCNAVIRQNYQPISRSVLGVVMSAPQ